MFTMRVESNYNGKMIFLCAIKIYHNALKTITVNHEFFVQIEDHILIAIVI
jgi:hypothetical protein